MKVRATTSEEKEIYGSDIYWIYDCKLPEDGQEVLITTKNGFVTSTTYDADYFVFESYEDVDDVVAWMPMPEPFDAKKK